MPISLECQPGCMSFDGGEVKHRRDCVHYPESLTKLWHDTEAQYIAEIDMLREALRPFALIGCYSLPENEGVELRKADGQGCSLGSIKGKAWKAAHRALKPQNNEEADQ